MLNSERGEKFLYRVKQTSNHYWLGNTHRRTENHSKALLKALVGTSGTWTTACFVVQDHDVEQRIGQSPAGSHVISSAPVCSQQVPAAVNGPHYDAVVSPSVAKLWRKIRPAKPKNLIPMKAAA
jgi:hypothetical protein